MTRATAAVDTLAEGEDRPITAASWWMVFVLFCFYLMSQIDRNIIAQFVDPIRKTYNLGGDLFDSGTVDFHTIKVGVNYRFGGPVVAKY